MIMRRGQQLLLPANPFFIWGSLLAALLLNMLQNMGLFGRAAWTPDMLALVLVFWSVHQPLRVGIGVAFVFGLLMDVHQGGLLGSHALAYTVMSFLAITIHRRLLWFTVPSQGVQVLPLFAAAQLLGAGGALAPYADVFNARPLNWLGLISRKPITEDYVPLIPWLGVMWWGMAAGQGLLRHLPAVMARPIPGATRPLAWLGRWSLSWYMLHQPVLTGVLSAVQWLMARH